MELFNLKNSGSWISAGYNLFIKKHLSTTKISCFRERHKYFFAVIKVVVACWLQALDGEFTPWRQDLAVSAELEFCEMRWYMSSLRMFDEARKSIVLQIRVDLPGGQSKVNSREMLRDGVLEVALSNQKSL